MSSPWEEEDKAQDGGGGDVDLVDMVCPSRIGVGNLIVVSDPTMASP